MTVKGTRSRATCLGVRGMSDNMGHVGGPAECPLVIPPWVPGQRGLVEAARPCPVCYHWLSGVSQATVLLGPGP